MNPQPQTQEKTATAHAIKRAVADLQAILKDGDKDHRLRDVIFNLARAQHYGRVRHYAASMLAENPTFDAGSDLVDFRLSEEAESLCIYTADNLIATVGSDQDDAWTQVEGERANGDVPSLEVRAFCATLADLRQAHQEAQEAQTCPSCGHGALFHGSAFGGRFCAPGGQACPCRADPFSPGQVRL